MNFPNLPTDSLYKYMAIGGIVIAIFSAYFLNDNLAKSNDWSRKAIRESEILNYRFESAKENFDSNDVRWIDLGIKAVESKNNFVDLNEYRDYYNPLLSLFSIFLIIGALLSGVGFWLWYSRLQKYQDRIIENEADRYLHEKGIRIHQVQFEKEFDVYNELWCTLIELKDGLANAHLQLSLSKDKPDFEAKKKMLFDDFDKSINKCEVVYKKNEPFYSSAVHGLVGTFVGKMLSEGAMLFMGRKGLEEGLKAIKEANSKIDEICLAIRQRIGSIEKA